MPCRARSPLLLAASLGALALACGERPALDRAALLDPASCAECHPAEYRDWSGSMHAYASDDPMLRAVNAFGQRQTGGALGALCIGCHAPMAVSEGATADGLDLDAVPRALRGVTCFYCHQIDAVTGDHNAAVHLADDCTMRGGLVDPTPTSAHRSAYSPLHDGRRLESSSLCGACHDVVTPAGVHLETTFAEWRESLFATAGPRGVSCSGCHMPGRDGVGADVPDAPPRRVHDHGTPGVDVALGEWPERATQRAAIERDLGPSVRARLCVSPPGLEVEVTLDNVLAGHAWPSGATHSRRAWVELDARGPGDAPLLSSGAFADDEEVPPPGDAGEAWVLGSRMLDASGGEVAHAWEAASSERELLPPAVTADPGDARFVHSRTRRWSLPAPAERVRIALRLRPVELSVVDALVASGDLDPAVRARVPTYTLAPSVLEWTAARGFGCVE